MKPSCNRLACAASLATGVLAIATAPAAANAADVRIEDDYIAIVIEAEDFDEGSLGERWVVTTPDTPAQSNDPDGNHSDQAVGSTYLEVLPDYRVTHFSEPGPVPSLWNNPGTGPAASYTVDFPEPGRYHVHGRAFTTGTEDNGIHFGLNGEFPPSGIRWQICAAGDNEWRWSSRQRDSGGSPCGVRKTIWLTIEEAGTHIVNISAREDGFELDRFMLIKDRSDNTRVCEPIRTEADNIRCQDGSIAQADNFVDLDVQATVSGDTGVSGDRFTFTTTVSNKDDLDTAHGTVLDIAIDTEQWNVVEKDSRCEDSEGGLRCTLGQQIPNADEEIIAATLEAIESGTLTVELSASANQADDIPDNDRVSFDILVDAPEPETTVLESGFGIAPTMLEVGAGTPVSFSITNTGVVASLDTSVTLKLASGLQATALSSGCANAASGVICAVGELSPGSSRDFTITLSATDAGTYIYATEARASNANATRNSRAVSVNDVVATDVDMDTDMGADTNTNTDTDTGMGMGMGTDNGGHDGDSGIPVTGEESKESASSAGSGGPLILLVLLGLVGGRLRVRQSFA